MWDISTDNFNELVTIKRNSNIEVNFMLGEKFRKLRKAKGINIYKAAEGITSKSSLQRWENGQGEMSIEKVLKLLNRIHIDPTEFITQDQPINDFLKKLRTLYAENNVNKIEEIANSYLKEHYDDPTNQLLLFQAASAGNMYMDFTNENLLGKDDILRLRFYFSTIEKWTWESLLYFGNTQLLMEPDDIYKNSRSLFSYLIDGKYKSDFYHSSVGALLNAVFVLLKKKSFKYAKSLLESIKNLNLSNEGYSTDLIRIHYAETVFNYIETNSTQEMELFLDNLESIGLKGQVESFKLGFKQFKTILNK